MKKINKAWIICTILVQLTIVFGVGPSLAPLNPEFIKFVEQQENGTCQNKTKDGHTLGYIPSPIKRVTSSQTPKDGIKLDPTYDLRNVGGLNYMTSVKNQLNCGCCWAFATMASIESMRLFSTQSIWDLSENHLKQGHGFEWGACGGGNADMATAYLSRGDGVILESDDPYTDLDQSNWNTSPPVMYMTDACYLPNNNAIIKQAIYDHGAIYTTMYWEDPSYNSSNKTYYYSGTQPLNHCVTLAGWDDTKVTAGGTGAWIIKNTWGPTWGESGYFYLSYNDTQVNTEVCFWPNKINYEPMRVVENYDYFGETAYFGFGDTNTSYAMVRFTAATSYTLSKLGTYAYEAGTTIKFEVYGFFDGVDMYDDLITSTSTHTVDEGGYVTLDLDIPISVYAGSEFFVKVYYNTPTYTHPIPVEQYFGGYAHATIQSNIFWMSRDGLSAPGSWFRLGSDTMYPFDPCVKAYATVPAAPNDVTITFEEPEIVLRWSHVPGALSYSVYQCDEPYGVYTLDTNGMFFPEPSWRTPQMNDKKFYHVIATNPKSKVKNKIRVLKK